MLVGACQGHSYDQVPTFFKMQWFRLFTFPVPFSKSIFRPRRFSWTRPDLLIHSKTILWHLSCFRFVGGCFIYNYDIILGSSKITRGGDHSAVWHNSSAPQSNISLRFPWETHGANVTNSHRLDPQRRARVHSEHSHGNFWCFLHTCATPAPNPGCVYI